MNSDLDALWHDPKNWRLGVIYVCRKDPRIVVSKRLKWTGWTFNFAHKGSYCLLFAVILLTIGPIFVYTDRYCRDISQLPSAILFSIIAIALLTILCARIGRS